MELDLSKIADKCKDRIKNRPVQFPGLSIRFTDPKSTILAFKSGKLVCTGSKSEEDARTTFLKFREILIEIYPEITIKSFYVSNYVASNAVGHSIRLETVYEKCRRNCIFEPELFPGLKFVTHNVTVIIFSTGKFFMTGSKIKADLVYANRIVCEMLMSCR